MSKLHVSRHNSLEWSVSGHLGGKQTLTPVVTAEGGGLACYKTALFTTNYVLWPRCREPLLDGAARSLITGDQRTSGAGWEDAG